ncbi:cation-binding protein [Photobacterium aquae]|uniref:Cation-binding protein n=1 Tax=Photobacterium aquae TaxID=1195763 RepID=A0A0J1GXK8_9GAMM|nr:hemerythrin domain-containing protein [Photobacterium aquae]KLV04398.1 cation-binding protein [Photobacterium aquae]
MMLDIIHAEHGNIVRLLGILQHKLKLIRNGDEVDYSLLRDIVEYLQSHAEQCHHPKEDVLYHYYQAHYADDNGALASLEQEHQQLAVLTHEFAELVDMILMDAVIPLDIFADKLNAFVDRQRAHLEFEECQIFPMIQAHFTSADWQAVANEYQECGSDPLFGNEVALRYRNLAERLRESA